MVVCHNNADLFGRIFNMEEHMKKFLTLLLVLAMVFSLVACSGGTDADVNNSDGQGGDSQGSDDQGDVNGDGKVRIHLVVGYLGDNSFNDAAARGCQQAADELGVDYTLTEYGSDKNALAATLLRAMEGDYDMIIVGNDTDYMGNTTIEENAADYPDTLFLIYDTGLDFTSAHSNVLGVCYKANESDFLAGAMASYMTKTGVIGWMGGAKIKGLDDFLLGYIDGCAYANPENKVAYAWIDKGADSWSDPVTGKSLSMNLYTNNHADFIHGVAGGSGDGVFDAVLDIRAAGDETVWGIGVDSDQYAVFMATDHEDKANVTITSALKVVGGPIFLEAQKLVNGETPDSGCMVAGITENAAGIAENDFYKANVPAEVQANIDAIKAAAASGELVMRSIYETSDEDYAEARTNGTVNQG